MAAADLPLLPLQGKTIVVTRPREQAGDLGEAIAELGGDPFYFPLLTISPVADPQALYAVASRLDSCAFAVFVSPNAVDHALPVLLRSQTWPSSVRPVAVGPGTAQALALAGVGNCLYPLERYDSESLLALPELQESQVKGKRVLIFRGNGGRELLGEELEARGALVERISCYQRSGPLEDKAVFLKKLEAGQVNGVTVSSSEALGYLLALFEQPEVIRAVPLFVSHARIAEKAESLGFHKVILVDAAAGGILTGLRVYNWSS